MKTNLDEIDSYMQLCAAIVNSGIKENDQVFLKSEWCNTLIYNVIEYNKSNNRHVPLVVYDIKKENIKGDLNG